MLQSLCLTGRIHLFHASILMQEAEKPYVTLLQLKQNFPLCSLPATDLQQLRAVSSAFLFHVFHTKSRDRPGN